MDSNVVPLDAIRIRPCPPTALAVRPAPFLDALHLQRVAEVLRDEAGHMSNHPAAMGLVAKAIGLVALADRKPGDMIDAYDEMAACWVRRL